MSDEDITNHKSAKSCIFCKKDFEKVECKVKDHCHITRESRGATHNSCNINYNFKNYKIPIICHNMKGYDSHFIISEAHKLKARKIQCIAANCEKLITYSFDNFKFLDSMACMMSSLGELVSNNKYTTVNGKTYH
jgi:hypothetical protein